MEQISYSQACSLYEKKQSQPIGAQSSEGARSSFSEMKKQRVINIDDYEKFLLFDNEYDYFVWLYPTTPKSAFSNISKEKIQIY